MIIDDIRKLCSFKNRGGGTEGEKKASIWLKERLENIGLETEIQEFQFPLTFAGALALHGILAIICSILSLINIWIAILLLLLIIFSYTGECTARFIILRRLLPSKISQNVIGKLKNPKAKNKIVICAHYDAAKCGVIYKPQISKIGSFSSSDKIGPLFLPFSFFIALFVILIFRMFLNHSILNIFQIIVTFLIVFFVLLPIQYELSPYADGASDDASGVAVVLALTEDLKNKKSNSEIIFLLTGAEEGYMIGMRFFMKKYKNLFDKENSYFISLDTIGNPELKYTVSEGFLFKQEYPDKLACLAEKVTKKDEFKNIKSTHIISHTDALISAILGYNSINLIGLDEHNVPLNYHQPSDIPENIDVSVPEKAKNFIMEIIKEIGVEDGI